MGDELGLFFLITGTLLEFIFSLVAVTAIGFLLGLLYQSLTLMNVAMKWALVGGWLGIFNKALWILINLMPLKEALTSPELARIVPMFTGIGGLMGIFYWRLRVKNRD